MQESQRRRRKVVKFAEQEPAEFDWELAKAKGTAPPAIVGIRFLVVAVIVIVILLVGLVALILGAQSPIDDDREGQSGPGLAPTDSDLTVVDAEIANLEMSKLLADVTQAVTAFLTAESVEELLDHVRGSEKREERIREYYRRHAYSPVEPRKVAPDGRIIKTGNLWALNIVLPDFSRRPIAVEQVDAGYKVDWESWVGYSEMGWDEFRSGRPTEPKLFRVLSSKADYFNYQFADDEKWRCFRLESPDRKHTLYGYVARYSDAASELTSPENKKASATAFVLSLRFPENPATDNQVLIDKVLQSGWVLGGKGRRMNRDATE